MSKENVTRRLSIYINDKEVVNSLGGIEKAKRAANAQLKNLIKGTEDYDKRSADLKKTLADLETAEKEFKEELYGTNSALEVSKNSLEGVEKRMKEVEKELRQLDTTSEDYQKRVAELREEYAKLESQQTEYTDNIRVTEKAHEVSRNSLAGIGKEISRVRREMDELDSTSGDYRQEVARLQAEEKALTVQQDKMKEEIHGTAEEATSAREALGNMFTGLLSGNLMLAASGLGSIRAGIVATTKSAWAFIATPIGMTIAALAGIALATKEWFDYNNEVARANKETAAITKLAGQELDDARVRATALSKSFNKDYDDVLKAAKALVNEFNISYTEAFQRIEDGFIKGGAASDDFLESLEEYPTFFAQAKFSVSEFQNLINTGIDLGIYSDKLPDAIKEFSLSITEQTKATKDALYNAFGTEFTDNLLQGVKDGTISVRDALYMVSEEAERLGLNAQQSQQLTADLFKGAGEDAGGALKIFNAVNKSLVNQNRAYTDVEQSARDLAQSERDLAAARDKALKTDGFERWKNRLLGIWNDVKKGFYDTVSYIVNSDEDIAKRNQKLLNEQFSSDAVKAFEDYHARRKKTLEKYAKDNKKSISDVYDFEAIRLEKINALVRDYRNIVKNKRYADDAELTAINKKYHAAIEAIKSYKNEEKEVNNKNSQEEIEAAAAAEKEKEKQRKKASAQRLKELEKEAKEARSLWIKSEMAYYDADKEISALLKKSAAEREQWRISDGEREDAQISARWDAEIEKYKEHTERKAELEAAKESELYQARTLRAEESAKRIREIEQANEQERLQRLFTNAQYLEEFERENQMKREIAAVEQSKLSEEEKGKQIELIKQKYAEREMQSGVALVDFYKNLELQKVKWSELGEKQKLALVKQGLNAAAELFPEGSAAWKVTKIAEAVINTRQAAIAAYDSVVGIPVVGPVLAPIAAAAALKMGYDQVRAITNTKIPKPKKFFYGGYTGSNVKFGDQYGGVTQVDAAGNQFHKMEYAIPEWMMKKPAVARTAEWLEAVRTGKTAAESTTPALTAANTGTAVPIKDNTNAALLVAINRLNANLENGIATNMHFGYEEVDKLEKMKKEMERSKNNGKLNT